MNDRLEITTLGGLIIKRDKKVVDGFVSRKAEALLVYLACTGRPQPRSVLANLLWDDDSEQRLMNNLRVLLSNLRQEVGPFVTISRETAAFDRTSPHWLDVAVLKQGLVTGQLQPRSLCPDEVLRLARTLELYQGDFLHGFYVRGSRGFEEWLALERERLRLRALEALQKLGAASLALGDYQAGLEYVGRLLQLDPLAEEGHRQKILLLAASGQRQAALAQYEQFRQLLASEMGIAPSAETTAVYLQLRAGQMDPNNDWRITATSAMLTGRPAPLPPCPYRGLNPFSEADRPFFFGRKSFTMRLVQRVLQQPLVAVVGPSGSGKTSVVNAGLLPLLRRLKPNSPVAEQEVKESTLKTDGDTGWTVASFRPAGYPCRALAGALIPLLETRLGETERLVEAGRMAEGFCRGNFTLTDVVDRILAKSKYSQHFLLVVDQFEELYTQCPELEERRHFLEILLQPLLPSRDGSGQATAGRIRLVLTLRADLLGRVLAYQPLASAMQESTLLLGSMTRQELVRAISQPAAGQGVTFEAGLVERILADFGSRPGQLPLLEFALTTLWDQQGETYGQLTHDAYEHIGQVKGALAQYADPAIPNLN